MSVQYLEQEFNKLLEINNKFSKWEQEFNDKLKNGKLISIRLFELIKRTPIDWDTMHIVTSIGTFTMNNNVDNFEYSLNKMKSMKIIKCFEIKKIGYKITLQDDSEIRFIQLTEFISEMDENVKKRLVSSERFGHCHWDSIHLSRCLISNNKVVSAYCTMASKKMPFPHSWVEILYNGKNFIIDFTMNLVMNKEAYYKLYDPKHIVEIDKEVLKQDLDLRSKTSLRDKDIRMYLFNPNEARDVMENELKLNSNNNIV